MSEGLPTLNGLVDPSLLALAAKKAFSYSNRHTWYHDRTDAMAFMARLGFHVGELSREIKNGRYRPGQKSVFPAPKRIVSRDGKQEFIYRPLCFHPFRDQVVEVALLTLFANHFEPYWGDIATEGYPNVASYGNRLHIVGGEGNRGFSGGNAHLYRNWSDDYAQFVQGTEHFFNVTLKRLREKQKVTLICTDLKSFYPSVDRERLIKILESKAKTKLFPMIRAVFGEYEVECSEDCPDEFSQLEKQGLPIGSAHSGFWANVYLEKFDQWVQDQLVSKLKRAGLPCSLEFYARYVDDMRFIFRSDGETADALFNNCIDVLADKLKGISLTLSTDKSSQIVQDASESLLSTGQIAERMQSITKRAYFPLPPEDLDELAKDVRLLFHANTDVPVKGAESSDSPHLLDNPGVRADSRRRFSANKWAGIARDMESMSPGWKKNNEVFAQELVRVWLEDPGQTQLLYRALEIGTRDVGRILKRLDTLKANRSSFGYYAHAVAYLLDYASYGARGINFKPWPLKQIAREVAKQRLQHRLLINKAQQYLLSRGRPLIKAERRLPVGGESNAWILRRRLEGSAHVESSLDESGEASILLGLDNGPRLLRRQLDALYELKTSAGRRRLTRSLLQRQPVIAYELAKEYAVTMFELDAFEPIESSASDSSKVRPLYVKIREGAYRSPLQWLDLAEKLRRLAKRPTNRSLIRRGLFNPFSLGVNEDGEISLKARHRMSTYIGYHPQPQKAFLPSNTRPWALPVGLTLRAAATGRSIDLLGISAAARFGLAGSFNTILRVGAKIPKEAGSILDRLFAWPGSRIHGYGSTAEFHEEVRQLARHVKACSADGKSICDVPVASDLPKDPFPRRFNLVICQVPSYPTKVDDATIRRALAMAQMVVRQKGKEAMPLDLIVFPELSLPEASIRTLCRFVRQTGALVLAGLELRSSTDGARRINELIWIVPLGDERDHFAILKQEKIHVTNAEKSLTPPVIEADPAVIWRIDGPKGRLAAINCYEFTDLLIRDLLRGRVEALVVASNNQDVTTFDNLIESTQYDLYSHVILVNADAYGGSAVRAPYRDAHRRRIFDIHGNNLFATNVCTVHLSDFRVAYSDVLKRPPAGFKLKP